MRSQLNWVAARFPSALAVSEANGPTATPSNRASNARRLPHGTHRLSVFGFLMIFPFCFVFVCSFASMGDSGKGAETQLILVVAANFHINSGLIAKSSK